MRSSTGSARPSPRPTAARCWRPRRLRRPVHALGRRPADLGGVRRRGHEGAARRTPPSGYTAWDRPGGDERERRASPPAAGRRSSSTSSPAAGSTPTRRRARRGHRRGLPQAGCALLGGETAEHPDMMQPDEFDLAGLLRRRLSERRELVSGARVRPATRSSALPSSGPHSNGFSLVRRLLERAGAGLDDTPAELGGATRRRRAARADRDLCPPGAELTRTVDVRGMAHITGGGHPGQPRPPVPRGLGAEIDLARGRGRRCSTGWPRSAWRRTRCAGSSTSAWGSRGRRVRVDRRGAGGARARRHPGFVAGRSSRARG